MVYYTHSKGHNTNKHNTKGEGEGGISMKMRTALVRGAHGLTVKRYDDYKSNGEFAEDLRANGFKVLKVWASYKTDAEVNEWELLNRK